ncbi:MAG: tail fiber domain-containing protein [Chitinophaga sp.]|uniref:tail fiber domain-containing protein n=1 Tax=Chitinophaga sp. TaxID=1869181 RepID=UPI001B038929|nr:tail fiber domain-containing protein [Chitinophaga sp.]MBO9729198.1 tail fiber domain-containing protein [Chitinophaga sp.]
MKLLFRLALLCLISTVSYAQTVYQIRADSVRIYSGCDTAELIIENHTKDTLGFLFNKGKGRTEFRRIRMKMLGNSLAIVGQDTIQLGTGAGGSAYIQNQNDSVQVANFSIDGLGKSGKGFVSNAGQQIPHYSLKVNNNSRWSIGLINPEPGSAIDGSDFALWRYNDAGTLIAPALTIKRQTGMVDMPSGLIAGPYSRIRGTGTGPTNQSYLMFMESGAVNEVGYIGKRSFNNDDLTFQSARGNVALSAYSAQDPQFNMGTRNLILKTGTLSLSDTTANTIVYAGYGTGIPSFNIRSKGTKLVLSPNINSTNVDHGIGLESGYTWFSVPQSTTSTGWKFYGGTTAIGKISGTGVTEWAGVGRFKGWADASAIGIAAEIGVVNGTAAFTGVDRSASPAKYIPVVLRGGTTDVNSKGFGIDSVGYRFIEFPNVKVLGTDANGYLVSKMPVLSDVLSSGSLTGNNTIVFNKTLAADNMLFDLQQGYALYSDNLASMDSRPGKRLWINTPDSGDIVLGPRAFAYLGGVLRIRMREIKLEGSNGKYVSYGALGTDANGYIVDGSANFVKNGTTTQTANFNVSGSGVLGGNLTVGGNEIVTGTVTATGFNQSSLRALKMNIRDCELNALRIIDSIKVREFEYKKEPGRKVIGIIADDEPAIISGEKHDHLDMMNAVGLLLKSVQELNARLDKLEQKVNQEQSSK